MSEDMQYARGAGDKVELRGEISADLMRAADALAQVSDMTRIRWVEKLIEEKVQAEIHRLSVLNRMLRGNPLLSAPPGVERKGDES